MGTNEQAMAIKENIKVLIEHNLKLDWQYSCESHEKREERWMCAMNSLFEIIDAMLGE